MADQKRSRESLGARKAMEFLLTSKLVDLNIPAEQLVREVSKLEEVAGYVLAWDRYVLVVGIEDLESIVSGGMRQGQ